LYETTRRSIPEDSHLHTRRRQKLVSHAPKTAFHLNRKYVSYVWLSFFKKESEAYEITIVAVCLSVCQCVVSPKNFKQLVDVHEIQQGGHAIEGDLDAILSNP
jgi:hypothetical protein